MHDIVKELSAELGLKEEYVGNVVTLIDEGSTIPFIARYRKEAHGSMDDTTLRKLEERLKYLRNLDARRQEILKAIEGRGKLTAEITNAVEKAATLAELEDIYRPYKQKRRTRATIAREKGLEPLAKILFAQEKGSPEPEVTAAAYTDDVTGMGNGVKTVKEALAGASDIIAEDISDMADVRGRLKKAIVDTGNLNTEAATQEDSVYSQYYGFSQPLRRLQDHQILAINRGEKEKLLRVSIEAEHDRLLVIVLKAVLKRGSGSTEFVGAAALDSLDRLILPSVEREIRSALTDRACEGAIRNFAINLRPLLMQPPVKGCVTMGLDPGYRMGCKVAVIDPTGKVLDTTVVYPTHGDRKKAECIRVLGALVKKHGVKHIAIGNGTASRETEAMAAEMIAGLNKEKSAGDVRVPSGLSYAMVNEAGASVYSASELAAREFPDYDVNLRSAVSIARRLQDPLAELVKIDPKAIGVGQYQHDMPQKELDTSLAAVVEDCVNAVGVDVNTASPSLLAYVSGINSTVAANILKYREENGAFTSRSQLKKVPKLGPKAFEQCAGFLRVPESRELLDHTGVHPESYPAARMVLSKLGISVLDGEADRKAVAGGDTGAGVGQAGRVVAGTDASAAAGADSRGKVDTGISGDCDGRGDAGTDVSGAADTDIVGAAGTGGRGFTGAGGRGIADAGERGFSGTGGRGRRGTSGGGAGSGHRSGTSRTLSELPRLVKMYGEEKLAAEAGIGVPTLMDIAEELARPGRDPRDELPPVVLRKDVLDISDLKEGMELKGTVRNVIDFGVFVDIGVHQDGLVHISEICDHYLKHPSEILSVGDVVDVAVLGVDIKKNRISLSMKRVGKQVAGGGRLAISNRSAADDGSKLSSGKAGRRRK